MRGWVDSGMKRIEVVAGIISNKDGDILCTQRNVSPYPYISKKYEFPGGKIEPGETREEALKREIFEELNIDIFIGSFFLRVMHQYPDFFLTMHSYNCISNSITIKLNEHINYKWLNANNLKPLDWAAADLPIVDKLISEYHE